MSDLEGEISAILRPVVKQLSALFNKHTAATFARAAKLSANAPQAPGAPKAAKAPAPAKAPKAKAAAKAAPAKAKGKRGGGSSNLEESLRSHIAANPGSRMEEISRVLGVPTKKLQGPAAKLLSAGSIRREGETRATRYFPGDGSAAAAAPAAAGDAPKAKGKPGPKKKG